MNRNSRLVNVDWMNRGVDFEGNREILQGNKVTRWKVRKIYEQSWNKKGRWVVNVLFSQQQANDQSLNGFQLERV